MNTRNPSDTGGLILIAGTELARGHQSPISHMVQVCLKMNILITEPVSTINYCVPISGLTGGHSWDLCSSRMSLFLNSTITVLIIFPLSIILYFLLRSICLLTWQCNWQVSNQSNRREIIAIFIITQRLLRFNYSGSNMRVMILLSLVLSLPWLCLTTLLLADQLNTWALAINCVCEGLEISRK